MRNISGLVLKPSGELGHHKWENNDETQSLDLVKFVMREAVIYTDRMSDVRPRLGVPRIGASERPIIPLSLRWPWTCIESPQTQNIHNIRVQKTYCYIQTVLCTNQFC